MRILITLLLAISYIFTGIYAFTKEEVQLHSIVNDCWVIFDNKVYNISPYIENHDIYLDIRSWCGTDISESFRDKGGIDRDHRAGSYNLLDTYYIGDLNVEETNSMDTYYTEIESIKDSVNSNDSTSYNIVLPLLFSIFTYWGMYFLVKKEKIKMSIVHFNGFWNTVLILLLLFPSLIFGIYMILRYRFTSLWDVNFDFMYWHVELSLVMAFIAINHFIQRFNQYLLQLKSFKRK